MKKIFTKPFLAFAAIFVFAFFFCFDYVHAASGDYYVAAIDESKSKIVIGGYIKFDGDSLQLHMKKSSEQNYSLVHEVSPSILDASGDGIVYTHTVTNLEPNTSYDFILKRRFQNDADPELLKTSANTLVEAPTLKNFSKNMLYLVKRSISMVRI